MYKGVLSNLLGEIKSLDLCVCVPLVASMMIQDQKINWFWRVMQVNVMENKAKCALKPLFSSFPMQQCEVGDIYFVCRAMGYVHLISQLSKKLIWNWGGAEDLIILSETCPKVETIFENICVMLASRKNDTRYQWNFFSIIFLGIFTQKVLLSHRVTSATALQLKYVVNATYCLLCIFCV